jgi:acetylornithine deacetylase/succinyl-diaminopimelate desuccinylase family protein
LADAKLPVQKIVKAVDTAREDIIAFAVDLVREPSENPPGDESGVAARVTSKAEKWGLPRPEVIATRQNRPNLVFTIGGSRPGRSLALSGHMDTKPVGDPTQWRVDPRTPQIVDGRLYGRGSTDMKGAVASIMAAAMALLSSGVKLGGDLILALTADEEAGSAYGAEVLIQRGFEPEAMIIAEPSGETTDFDCLGVACRGAVLGRIVVHGTQMHSSLSDRGGCVNASVKLARVLTEFADNFKSHLRYTPNDLYPRGPTINPGVILEGGVFYGVVPGRASFGFDIRVTPGLTLDSVVEDINGFLAGLMSKDEELVAELVLEDPAIRWAPAATIRPDHPLVTSCLQAAREIVGVQPRLGGMPFGTEAAFYKRAGLRTQIIPAFGPGLIELAHRADEYVNIKAVLDGAKLFAVSAATYLSR